MGEIFRSSDLLARYVPGALRSAIVVTFDSYTDNPTLDRSGFGETLFAAARVPAIHIISCTNDWYQSDEMPALLAEVAKVTAKFPRVLSYGSSMGGYAAIRFADAVRANRVLALSPQYSVDPAKVPWEARWGEAKRIRFNEAARIVCKARPVVVYDSHDLDRRHVELIGGDIEIDERKVPYAGHPALAVLIQGGVARDLALRMVDADPQIGPLLAKVRRQRHRSPTYLSTIALKSRHKPRAFRFAELAAHTSDPFAKVRFAAMLREAGRFDEAVSFHADAVRMGSRDPQFLVEWSDTLACAGDAGAAVPLAIEAAEASPQVAYRQHWASHVLYLAGRAEEARPFNRRALILDPANDLYAKMASLIG